MRNQNHEYREGGLEKGGKTKAWKEKKDGYVHGITITKITNGEKGREKGKEVKRKERKEEEVYVCAKGNNAERERDIPIAIIPKLQMSTFGPYSFRVTTSGAIQYGVPTIVVRLALPSDI